MRALSFLPSTLADPVTRPNHGARRLWLAVLEQALIEAAREDRTGTEARAYLHDPTHAGIGSFAWLCDELDLEPSTLHAYAEARYGVVPQPGDRRDAYMAGRTPAMIGLSARAKARRARRLLSATTARACVACGTPFATAWRQQHACSPLCARRAKRRKAE